MTLPTFAYDRMVQVVQDQRFQQMDVTLLRPIFGTMELGRQPVTFEEPLVLRCCVQPASPDDLQQLDEGQRVGNIKAVWSVVPLYTGNAKDHDADVLEIDGVRFTVVKELDRQPNGYHKVLAEGYVV